MNEPIVVGIKAKRTPKNETKFNNTIRMYWNIHTHTHTNTFVYIMYEAIWGHNTAYVCVGSVICTCTKGAYQQLFGLYIHCAYKNRYTQFCAKVKIFEKHWFCFLSNKFLKKKKQLL